MSKYRLVGVDHGNRRRDRRTAMPAIDLEIEGVTYTTIDWSLGGFLAAPYEGTARAGETFPVTILVNIADHCYRHRVEAQVVRHDRMGARLAAAFVGLPADALDTLEGLITGRLRRLPH